LKKNLSQTLSAVRETKRSGNGSVTGNGNGRLKSFLDSPRRIRLPESDQVLEERPARNENTGEPARIVGIGASAGGLEAFTELLKHLPVDAGVAYVLVQHLDPTHRSLLSELLAKTTTLPVREIAEGTRVQANQIYVIPPNCDLAIHDGVLKLSPREKGAGPARSIDTFLRSLALDQKERAIGVILSGAGSDGAQGLKAIKSAGGCTFAQDNRSARYDSMPRSALGTGCVDFVLSPKKIAQELARIVSSPDAVKRRAAANAKTRVTTPRSSRSSAGVSNSVLWPNAPQDINLRKLFQLLRAKTAVDFAYYKSATIQRRLTRGSQSSSFPVSRRI
jgi:two-component system CheB/CheR fusion protein